MLVAIDGPAGSGKSTVARSLARALDVPHVDTGAYYRAAALAALRAGVDLGDEAAILETARNADISRPDDRAHLGAEDVEEHIRSAEVDAAVSQVASHAALRTMLVALQRSELWMGQGVVEGRDAGTNVVPDADLKVWLTATPLERARRRSTERHNATGTGIEGEVAALVERDRRDTANMVQAPDVYTLDTTDYSITEVVAHLLDVLRETTPGRAT